MKSLPQLTLALLTAAAVTIAGSPPAQADQVILDDLIVDGSACVGLDCVNGESFGFDTLRLKENNLRINFTDTSSAASFPDRDWTILVNDSSNGGLERFSIQDVSAGRIPVTVEGNAPSHSLYVDDGGRIGLGTSTPVVELHVVDGDSPTLRLEQDGSSGFTPQTWDLAGNETNFFVRDVTNGSQLPFRIRPGAPTSAIDVAANGNVGIGDTSPDAALNIERSNGTAQLLIEETNASAVQRDLITLVNSGQCNIRMTDNSTGNAWSLRGGSTYRTFVGGNVLSTLDTSGNVTFAGTVAANNGANTLPDYVFEEGYDLMPLAKLEEFIEKEGHLPRVPNRGDVEKAGGVINMSDMQMRLLEKVEELTLYTLEQEKTIKKLNERLESLESN